MPVPKKISSTESCETFGGVSYHITGELVPVLNVDLQNMSVFFEHHVLLWKDTSVHVGLKSLQGVFKRIVAGMPLLMIEAKGPGNIGFSRDAAGHVFPLHLNHGQSIEVREHQFLAATNNLDYNFKRVKGVSNMLLGGTGFFIDTFTAKEGDGILWVHGYGNVFEVVLGDGEQIDIEPGAWVYKDEGVHMETIFQKLTTGFIAGSSQIFWNRFTGPGKIGIQSMAYYYTDTSN
ncbi:MAG: AIM24 family protein [Cyanobacteriota bacterium]